MATATALFESRELLFAELRCPPDDPEWGEDNSMINTIVALPSTPMWQVHGGSERRLFNQNHVIVHHPGTEYRRERFQDQGYRCLFLIPSASLVGEVLADLVPSGEGQAAPHSRATTGPLDSRTFGLSRFAAQHLRSGLADPSSSRELLYVVLRRALTPWSAEPSTRPSRSPATRRARREIVEEAKGALISRMSEPISLDDLAGSLYTSPYHLARLFRSATGFSIHGYLTHLRLRTGLERIQGGSEDIGDVGASLGYRSHSHFTSSFHRAFGLAPSGVRRIA